MNKDLDLTKVLKDCPKGTKFYSIIYGDVYFEEISDGHKHKYHPIRIKIDMGLTAGVTVQGLHDIDYKGECTLFPDKNQRDWSKWQRPFVDGDIIFTRTNNSEYNYGWLSIFKEIYDNNCISYLDVYLDKFNYSPNVDMVLCDISEIVEQRLATEEEKQKLFDVIREKGYKWNAEAKMMEKLPKDRFDPKTLIPFESKVLVRDGDHFSWVGSIYTHRKENGFYTVNGTYYRQCIPYNDDTAYLIGTYKEAPEYYRYWEV